MAISIYCTCTIGYRTNLINDAAVKIMIYLPESTPTTITSTTSSSVSSVYAR